MNLLVIHTRDFRLNIYIHLFLLHVSGSILDVTGKVLFDSREPREFVISVILAHYLTWQQAVIFCLHFIDSQSTC